jgi:hypothetical protein
MELLAQVARSFWQMFPEKATRVIVGTNLAMEEGGDIMVWQYMVTVRGEDDAIVAQGMGATMDAAISATMAHGVKVAALAEKYGPPAAPPIPQTAWKPRLTSN